MKINRNRLSTLALVALAIFFGEDANGQQYKLRQVTSMTGMKSESTIYVKGLRKRTEGGGFMGAANLVTIEQCDLQRTISINDKKKLYFIAPFGKDNEEIIDEDVKPSAAKKPVAAPKPATPEKGGVIHMWYNITDTGERKKMYGIVARHVWTAQKIKPSADACMMKDSMLMKTDGWYIDLPEFNCRVNRWGNNGGYGSTQPTCKDRYVTHRSGKGKLGFPLIEKRTIIMGNGPAKTSEFETSIETLEFSTAKLDSMLFEIPVGYKLAATEEELQDKFDVSEMMKQAGVDNDAAAKNSMQQSNEKKAGTIRIGVFEPKGSEALQFQTLQQQLVSTIKGQGVDAIAVSSVEEAKKYNCDYLLATDFTRFKQASKVGGILKAIKNTDPSAASSFNIEANLLLTKTADGTTRLQEKVDGKYEGRQDEAARKALERGGNDLINAFK